MASSTTTYGRIASRLGAIIARGQLTPGDKLPSVRQLAQANEVSAPTAERALRELESLGLVVARPRSGYYVAPRQQTPAARPLPKRPAALPRPVTLTGQVHDLFAQARSPDLVMLGAATPCPDWLPSRALARSAAAAHRRLGAQGVLYSVPPGRMDLRRQIAKRALRWDGNLDPDKLIITAGATQAMQIALGVVTKAGDTVAVESPCYFGTLMLLKAHGLKALEIPAHADRGMDLDVLESALKRYRIAAVVASPTANNPSGFTMPVKAKQRLVKILAHAGVPLIEDDPYGDITMQAQREPSCKTFDTAGMVLYCSSVSKTLAPGWRTGWLEAGRFVHEATEKRVEASLAGSPIMEAALADLMLSGDYDRHLRRFAARTQASMRAITARIRSTWPPSARYAQPHAGFLLWLELAAGTDTRELMRQGQTEGFSICPGAMFSADGSLYSNCLRMNTALPATPQLLALIDRIGELIAHGAAVARSV
ncbi:PLP-dependent aminotransferase family protein [Achromobacter sp. SD115]|uniref:aminotransferase-like domain-containing protein n=1 Tax=Achromobacter sp. SD115 TaxID=2782011 RepID=UPI001A96675E|nr:PLP-dependent aminotransferase family protein [Achromobacter sp. SD115]MBO1015631.1 PLP-dependent aminotransferase family protein [Achromobacter sp. SD115]